MLLSSKKILFALSLTGLCLTSVTTYAADKATDDELFSASDSGTEEHNVPHDGGPSGVYLHAGIGYALTFMRDRIGTPVAGNWTNHAGGFTYGGDIGYQFNNIFSVEGGGFGLPSSTLKINATNLSTKFTTWAAYVGGKMRVYLYERTHLFAKLGLSYQQTKLTGNGVVTTTTSPEHQWGAMFAVGTEYNFTPSWMLSMQYARLPGRVRNTSITTPPATASMVPDSNIILVSVGYLFGQKDASESNL